MDQDEDPFNPTPTQEGEDAFFDNAFEDEPAAQDDDAFAPDDAFAEHENQDDVFGEDNVLEEQELNGDEGYDAFQDDAGFVVDNHSSAQQNGVSPDIIHNVVEQPLVIESSSALKQFEQQFNARIAEKDETNRRKKEEMKQIAAKDLESFLLEYKNKCETKHSNNKQEEEEFTKKLRDAEQGDSLNPWDRIVSLVDLSEKSEGRDVTRLKNMLIQLKNSNLD